MQRVSEQLDGLLKNYHKHYLATIYASRADPKEEPRPENASLTIYSVKETPGFLDFARELGYSVRSTEKMADGWNPGNQIVLQGGRVYTSAQIISGIGTYTSNLVYSFRELTIVLSEDLEEWLEMCDRHHHIGPIHTGVGDLPRGLRLEISRGTGLPSVCMRHLVDIPDILTSKKMVTSIEGKRAVLLRAYEAIVEHAPYDLEEQNLLVGLINAAHDHSLSTLNLERLKVDYDLVILPGYREFRRIQESPEIDYDREALPRYWFDPVDLRVDGGAAEAMNVLAIERSWAEDPTSTTRYLLTCGFPAGSMFLRTKIEAQATTPGGGIEYIYLQRPDDKRRVVTLDSRKVCLASEPR